MSRNGSEFKSISDGAFTQPSHTPTGIDSALAVDQPGSIGPASPFGDVPFGGTSVDTTIIGDTTGGSGYGSAIGDPSLGVDADSGDDIALAAVLATDRFLAAASTASAGSTSPADATSGIAVALDGLMGSPDSTVPNGGSTATLHAMPTGTPSASAVNPVVSTILISTGAGNLSINLELDANAASAPASYISGWETAATLLSEAIHDPITVNIEVGYTEYPGNNSTVGAGSAEGGPAYGNTYTYTQLRNFLSGTGSSDVISAVNDLPITSSLNGQTNFFAASAEAKAWRQISATNTAIDGYTGYGSGIPSDAIVGVALHEFTHAMGRTPGDTVLFLFDYTSSGSHYPGNFGSASYFSVDGGKTVLADFGETSDPSDFLNNSLAVNDPFDEFYTAGSTLQSLTALDQTMLDMLGFGGLEVVSSQTFTVSTGQTSTGITVLGGGTLIVAGGGTVSATFDGGKEVVSAGGTTVSTTISGSGAVLDLLSGAVVSGGVTFSGSGGELQIAGTTMPTTTISGFVPGDTFDLTSIAFGVAGGVSLQPGNVLLVNEDGSTFALNLDPGQSFIGDRFQLSADSGSGTLISEKTGQPAPRDFNGDGTSEVLWHNSATGDTGYWTTDGAGNVTGFHDFGAGSTAYAVAGLGDFDGKSKAELLWHNSASGDTGYWTTDSGGNVAGFQDLGAGSTAYAVAGVGDFDGSGRDEVLWHNSSTGDTGYWTTNSGGTSVTGFHDLGAGSTAYAVAGVGDFDLSGRSEALWHNSSTGDTGYWQTNSSGTVTGFHDFGAGSTAYSIAGVGDFDGTGKSEILWHDSANGDTGYWQTNSSGTVTGFHDLGAGSTAYAVAGVGDFDNSGRSEVLWRNSSTGDTGYWVTNVSGTVTGFHDYGAGSTAYGVV